MKNKTKRKLVPLNYVEYRIKQDVKTAHCIYNVVEHYCPDGKFQHILTLDGGYHALCLDELAVFSFKRMFIFNKKMCKKVPKKAFVRATRG